MSRENVEIVRRMYSARDGTTGTPRFRTLTQKAADPADRERWAGSSSLWSRDER